MKGNKRGTSGLRTKRIWRFEDSARAMFLDDIPQPQPGPDELLIRIWAAGVTPTELWWCPTTTRKAFNRLRHLTMLLLTKQRMSHNRRSLCKIFSCSISGGCWVKPIG